MVGIIVDHFSLSSIANVRDYVHILNMARNDLRQRFARGIRFWNSDTVSYSYEIMSFGWNNEERKIPLD